MSLDKAKVNAISADIIASIKEIEEKHNVSIRDGGGRYDSNEFTMKIKVTSKDESGNINHFAKEADDFERYGFVHGLEGQLHKTFEHHGDTLIVVGFKTRAKKNNIILQKSEDFGKSSAHFVGPASLVKSALNV